MIQIFADTLSCISPAEARHLGLVYIPQNVIFGEKTYRDDSQIDAITFLKKLKASPVMPKTSAPAPAEYMPHFRRLADNGDTAIVICPSEQVSGTYRSAMTAMQEVKQDCPTADIRVIDTHLIAGGLGAIVKQALCWVESGDSPDQVEAKVVEMATRERIFFMVATLEFLHRGGRIGTAKALFGSILQVKPILTIRHGHTEPYESTRTHKRAVARLKEIIMEGCPRDPEAHLCIMHGDAEELAREFAADLGQQLGIPVASIPIYDLTPAILTHSGPGAIAISYFVAPGQEANN
jgi:DegV family protein with EDD domain